MAGRVFFGVTMSLDGFIAPEERVDDPDVQRWMAQWMELQQWIFPQRFFPENLKLGEGGEEGRDNDIGAGTSQRTGASVMGKRMFDLGEQAWPEEAPFHTPVFVVTHEKRDAWERPGGTAFRFVNDGIEPALDQAREAAGDRDVRIAGGGATILEYVNAGLIDEFSIALSPVLFGSGIRLFEGVDAGRVALEPVRAEPTERGVRPHLRSPGAVSVSTSAFPGRGQQRGEILDVVVELTRQLRLRQRVTKGPAVVAPAVGPWTGPVPGDKLRGGIDVTGDARVKSTALGQSAQRRNRLGVDGSSEREHCETRRFSIAQFPATQGSASTSCGRTDRMRYAMRRHLGAAVGLSGWPLRTREPRSFRG